MAKLKGSMEAAFLFSFDTLVIAKPKTPEQNKPTTVDVGKWGGLVVLEFNAGSEEVQLYLKPDELRMILSDPEFRAKLD